MLFIMLFAMMHNAFPHVHHEHRLVGDVELRGDSHHHHHHDSNDHHHSGEDENDHDQKTFFDFLFKDHSHTRHTHQYTPTTVEHVKPVKQLNVKVFNNSDSWEFAANETDVGLHRYMLFNDIGSDDPCLCSNPLRGPPSFRIIIFGKS